MADDGARWVSMSAAARALGVSRQAIRGRIGRGTLETRREREGNRERLLVRLPEGLPEPLRELGPQRSVAGPVPDPRDALLAELRERVAALERRLDEGHAERLALLELLARREGERHRPGGVLARVRRWL